jgi:hypothetical protein
MIPRFLNEVSRILRPGGLFLSAEWGVCPTLHPVHPSLAQPQVYIPKTISFYNVASCVGFLSTRTFSTVLIIPPPS